MISHQEARQTIIDLIDVGWNSVDDFEKKKRWLAETNDNGISNLDAAARLLQHPEEMDARFEGAGQMKEFAEFLRDEPTDSLAE